MDRPDGFEEYWAELRAEVGAADKDWDRAERRELVGSRGKTWKVDWIRFSSLNDQVVQGWIAVPYDHAVNGAGFLWLPGYSYGTPPPDDSNLVAGAVTFAINVHGYSPEAPYTNPAGKNDYILRGIESPYTYIYRSIVANCLCAVDVLGRQSEVTKGVGVGGMSQGGGLALLTASQDSRCRICCADMPFLADVRTSVLKSRSGAYRALKLYCDARPEALEVVCLFDSLYHAESIDAPIWLSAGGKDPTCIPAAVEAVFERLASTEKRYELFPQAGHVFLAQMNAAYQQLIARFIAV